jgi:uncharacterized protein (DUF2164 family)
MKIRFSKEKKDKMLKEIQNFFYNEMDKEIGIIAAETVLDFFLEELGDIIYNQALNDAKLWFVKKMEDIEFDYDLLYK